MIKFVIFLSIFACVGCTTEGKRAMQSGEPPSVPPQGAEAGNAQAPPPYLAVNQVERPLLPLSITHGVLSSRDGCVVFSASGKEFTPVWPMGTRLVLEGGTHLIAYRDKRLKIGDNVALPGGPLSLSNKENLRIETEIPAQCPTDVYAVG